MNEPRDAMSGYVWDRSGSVDAEVARLERVLSGQRHRGTAPELVIGAGQGTGVERGSQRSGGAQTTRGVRGRGLAAAATVLMAVGAAWLARPASVPWLRVEAVSGSPVIGSRAMDGRMPVGRWLQTDEKSEAAIEVATLGTVTVKPNTKIRVMRTGEREHRLEMPYGRIHAFITAPPRVFVVDTPLARAVDMGCEYTLEVEKNGSGVLRVMLGHVLLEGRGGVVSEVPMFGGVCRIREGVGPGTPYFDDASSAFVAALERFDFEGGGDAELRVVLEEARERDALSLWHLVARTNGAAREAVVARLEALKPRPERVSREAVLRLDGEALRAWNKAMRPY